MGWYNTDPSQINGDLIPLIGVGNASEKLGEGLIKIGKNKKEVYLAKQAERRADNADGRAERDTNSKISSRSLRDGLAQNRDGRDGEWHGQRMSSAQLQDALRQGREKRDIEKHGWGKDAHLLKLDTGRLENRLKKAKWGKNAQLLDLRIKDAKTPKAKAAKNLISGINEEGYRYTYRSDGSTITSPFKERASKESSSKKKEDSLGDEGIF